MDRETIEQRFPVGSRWRTGGGSDIVIRAIDKFGVRWAYSDGDSGGAHIPWDTWASWSEEYERLDDTPAPASKPEPVVRVGQVWRTPEGDDLTVITAAEYERGRRFCSMNWDVCVPLKAHYGMTWLSKRDMCDGCTLLTDAPPQPVEPPKPAVMCEYPDALGRRHALTTTAYDCCAVCGASARDRRAARRRAFDADVETHEHPWVDYRNGKLVEHVTRYVAALKSGGPAGGPASPVMPSAAMAIDALWQKLEAKRGAR